VLFASLHAPGCGHNCDLPLGSRDVRFRGTAKSGSVTDMGADQTCSFYAISDWQLFGS
jgi:hypothetical protein